MTVVMMRQMSLENSTEKSEKKKKKSKVMLSKSYKQMTLN